MTSTALMRQAWGPPCTGPFKLVRFYGVGVATVRAATVPAWAALDLVLEKHDYETRKEDTGAYNCRKITGGSNYSLHAYGIAVDFNWLTNPYGPRLVTDMPIRMIEDIEAIRTNSGHRVFRWGGRYSGNKDAMHFELICTPAQLASGIKESSLPQMPVVPLAPEERDISMEAALILVEIHYDNARGGGTGTYDVRNRDRVGYQHWVSTLLDAYDKGQPLKPIVDSLGLQLYAEMTRNK